MEEREVVIVIVSYNSADLVIDCLRSIASEPPTLGIGIRAIVVDNASGDATTISQAIAVNSWAAWVTLIESPRNGGFAYGNNLAIERAYHERTPDYIYLLNPDTIVRPGAISALTCFLENHPEVGIVGSSLENLDGTDWPFAFRFPSIISEFEAGLEFGLITRLLRRWVVPVQMPKLDQRIDWVSGASMMIRREVIDTIGGFDEGYFLYFEETDFCLRAARAGFSTWYVPESRVMHAGCQSTKLTEAGLAQKRLPAYWFESRRRYFMATHGPRYAATVDIVALVAHLLGACKRRLQCRNGKPYFIRDFLKYSILWPKNRRIAAVGRSVVYKPCSTNSNQKPIS